MNDLARPLPERRLLTDAGVNAAAHVLRVEPAVVRAVCEVEAAGNGFLPDGRPKILFEGHQFSRRTDHAFDESHPTISYPRWTKVHYIGGVGEYARLAIAKALNETAALESTSWGGFQVMGFNHRACGFDTVQAFVIAMHESADRHLLAFVDFVESTGLGEPLRTKSWVDFARGYNGNGQVEVYAGRMARAYLKHSEAARSSATA